MGSYWLLIVLGLVLDPTVAKAQFDSGGLYENYTDFEACHNFQDGDQNIKDERWDIGFRKCLDRWFELD